MKHYKKPRKASTLLSAVSTTKLVDSSIKQKNANSENNRTGMLQPA